MEVRRIQFIKPIKRITVSEDMVKVYLLNGGGQESIYKRVRMEVKQNEGKGIGGS